MDNSVDNVDKWARDGSEALPESGMRSGPRRKMSANVELYQVSILIATCPNKEVNFGKATDD